MVPNYTVIRFHEIKWQKHSVKIVHFRSLVNSVSLFWNKNFVKSTFLLDSFNENWFHEKFLSITVTILRKFVKLTVLMNKLLKGVDLTKFFWWERIYHFSMLWACTNSNVKQNVALRLMNFFPWNQKAESKRRAWKKAISISSLSSWEIKYICYQRSLTIFTFNLTKC